MTDVTFAACESCGSEGEVELPPLGISGPLTCSNCGSLITILSVRPWAGWIEAQVVAKADRQRAGSLGTRKQSGRQSDVDIDRDGMETELAACLLMCPGYRREWVLKRGPNRGNDLPPAWTGLPMCVEVKQTRYRDASRGYLLVRPPRRTPGRMLADYDDDCLYVLMHGANGLYTLVGWADRDTLLCRGRLNPVPVRPGQRECWGIHWSRLHNPNELISLKACHYETAEIFR